MRALGLCWISAALLAFAASAQAGTFTVAFSEGLGIRDSGDDGTPDGVLDFMAIKDGTEDRTVLHFPLAGLPTDFLSAFLILPIGNLDEGDAPGTEDDADPFGDVDVFTFLGDGVVSLDEYTAGVSLGSLAADPDGTLFIGVAVALSLAQALNATHLSFRLSTVDADRYFLGGIIGLPDPTLRVVAEPGGIAAAAAMLAAAAARRRASGR